jgi:uncharacterized protein YndB with AHSA1/START domain
VTIAPIVHSVTVSASPERAFALFTGRMGGWWKPGMTIGAQPHVEIVVEPRVDGRWFERDADGNETDWGKVLAWEPPGRALLGWQLNGDFAFDPELVTEVEIMFVPVGTGTRVTLTHSRLERYGDAADRVAAQLSGGWPSLVQMFADFAEEQAQ